MYVGMDVWMYVYEIHRLLFHNFLLLQVQRCNSNSRVNNNERQQIKNQNFFLHKTYAIIERAALLLLYCFQ